MFFCNASWLKRQKVLAFIAGLTFSSLELREKKLLGDMGFGKRVASVGA
ncbi:hypothetical protein RSSM_00304 [Rhodopirellula sallentina SM41]|uniref:Uncharacterized protein n=1 Tax=Rhodopirellula sallentina SM41 TaxID=1263870 RepID=M5UAB6_9BACT|nr:hypothetical protein RSSM_00304 [Rhodopirellula sallentina SM41]